MTKKEKTMEEEFYASIIERLSVGDSIKMKDFGDILEITEKDKFENWASEMGLVVSTKNGISISWPIKISQFLKIFIAGNLEEYHDWINSLKLRMSVDVLNFKFTLYHEKDDKRYDLLTIWKDNQNRINFNSYGIYFDCTAALNELIKLKVQLTIKE
jgi:hypothetical protein